MGCSYEYGNIADLSVCVDAGDQLYQGAVEREPPDHRHLSEGGVLL